VFNTLSFPDLEVFPFLDDVPVLDFDSVFAPISSSSPSSPTFKGMAAST